MTEAKTTQTLGIKINTTGNYGADVIPLASTEYYKLGTFYQSFGDFINDQRELNLDLTGLTRNPNQVTVSKLHTQGGIMATAVNALPFYLAMGKYTTDGASLSVNKNQIDFVGFDAQLPEFNVRQEEYNSTVGMYDNIVGNYIQNLNAALDLRQRGSYMSYNMTIPGQRRVAPQFGGASDAGSLVYPGSPTEEENEYKFDSNTLLNIDGTFSGNEYSTGGDDITSEILDISFMIDNGLIPHTPNGQLYPKRYSFGYQIPAVSLTLHRQNSQKLYDEFNAMADGTTTTNLYFKVYQSANDYQEWHIEGWNISSMKRPNVNTNENNHEIIATGNPKNVRVIEYSTNVDGDTYYV